MYIIHSVIIHYDFYPLGLLSIVTVIHCDCYPLGLLSIKSVIHYDFLHYDVMHYDVIHYVIIHIVIASLGTSHSRHESESEWPVGLVYLDCTVLYYTLVYIGVLYVRTLR